MYCPESASTGIGSFMVEPEVFVLKNGPLSGIKAIQEAVPADISLLLYKRGEGSIVGSRVGVALVQGGFDAEDNEALKVRAGFPEDQASVLRDK